MLFEGAGRSPPRIAIAACFAALVLHTWTYADFLEDPLTWTLLGIGVALARARPAQAGATHPLGRAAASRAASRPQRRRLRPPGAAVGSEPCAAISSACSSRARRTSSATSSPRASRSSRSRCTRATSRRPATAPPNSLLTAVILASIFLRVGVGEAFIRFYFDDADEARRERIARTATATVACHDDGRRALPSRCSLGRSRACCSAFTTRC